MDTDRTKMLVQLLGKLPLIARVALLHMLHMSPPSRYVDLRTELTVAVLRSILTPSKPATITGTQRLVNADPGIKGRIWIAKYTAPAPPEPSLRDVVIRAVEAMRPAALDGTPPPPLKDMAWADVVPVEAEWTGYRRAASPSSRLPLLDEVDKYREMMKEVTSPITVLYLHGGAYYLMDPATHRPTTKKIAKLTGGRCYSVRYRLAPQNPFPAALIDALQSYLALLYPPPGAFHDAVKPEHIVFAGDSAGGNLCMALTQLLLQLKRTNTHVAWHGRDVAPPLPAGLALSSPWLDMTFSSPSCKANAAFDYLPQLEGLEKQPRPSCPAWPASPPRRLLYCADALITHPLVTLLTARSWEGCPPVYLSTGWELLADEGKFMAARLHAAGVPVVWEEFEGMPHCFAMILTDNPMSRRCFDGWTAFMRDVVERGGPASEEEAGAGAAAVESAFRTVKARTLEEVDRDPAKVSPYTEEEMWERLRSLASQGSGTGTRVGTGEVPAKL